MTVVAVDDGVPALSATQILTVVVLDVNDEKPIFAKALYEASIYENNDPGEIVIKIEAMDKDSGNLFSFLKNRCYLQKEKGSSTLTPLIFMHMKIKF